MAWEKCPKCGRWLVEYDAYRQTKRCYDDECGVKVLNDGSYYFVRRAFENSGKEKIQVVKKTSGGEEIVLREIK